MKSPANGLEEKPALVRSNSSRTAVGKRKLKPRAELTAFFTVVQMAMVGVFVIQVISLQKSVAKNYSGMAADTVGALRLAYTLKHDQVMCGTSFKKAMSHPSHLFVVKARAITN
jgi:hypothetical protein